MARKTKAKEEAAPPPVIELKIDQDNVGAFRAYGKAALLLLDIDKKGRKTQGDAYTGVEAIAQWAIKYGGANEEQINALNFDQLFEVWDNIVAFYGGTDIPK